MGRNHDKWLLNTARTFEEASTDERFSEMWRREMSFLAGHFYGRYYAYVFCVGGPVRISPMREALKSPGPFSANTLARLVRMPEQNVRVRI